MVLVTRVPAEAMLLLTEDKRRAEGEGVFRGSERKRGRNAEMKIGTLNVGTITG